MSAIVPWMHISNRRINGVLVMNLGFFICTCLHDVMADCDFAVLHGSHLYNFSLTRSTREHPHGILSVDGFYKVEMNKTILWFQLCDKMIFNHDIPRCFGCQDCGGEKHCGMTCSALIANKIGGYPVCTTIGKYASTYVSLIDVRNPLEGIIVRMSTVGSMSNCSITVSIFCDKTGIQEPNSFRKLDYCVYATGLRHPLGCPTQISNNRSGWGWFGTLIIILLCLFGGYMIIGVAYRFFLLGVRDIEAVPNMEFWRNLSFKIQGLFGSLEGRLSKVTISSSTSTRYSDLSRL